MANSNLYLNVPESDMAFITLMAERMGWKMETCESLLEQFLSSRPADVDMSDKDIMDEVRAIRYAK